jgi:phosphoserine phosphatase RsbU/P
MRFKRTFLVIITVGALLIDFVYLISISAIQGVASADAGIIHTALLLIGFSAFVILQNQQDKAPDQKPIRYLFKIVIATVIQLILLGAIQLSDLPVFELDGYRAIPSSMVSIISSAVLGIVSGLLALVIFQALTHLVFIKRRKTTKRNYQILLIIGSIYIALEYSVAPNGLNLIEPHSAMSVVPVLMGLAMLVNAFRFSWIVFLTRREKLASLALTFVGLLFSAAMLVWMSEKGIFTNSLTYFNPAVHAFVSAINTFSVMYMGIGFVSTLLHLPTAKEFDRKKVEISSFQNMGRLMTRVLDYDELTVTSTQLAMDMCEGEYAWIELLVSKSADEKGNYQTYIIPASMKNVTEEEILKLRIDGDRPLQYLSLETRKSLIISDVSRDRRLINRSELSNQFGSIALLPLHSHKGLIGLLCVAKRAAFEFDADMLNGLYAFADMVSIALENSKLIEQSIEKQRMEQELLVAQEMQKKLLPRNLPKSDKFEIAAASIPAYEVGGDYYDLLQMEDGMAGIVIGDVSGKGTSAALYMAQVKGIFQSLGTYIHKPGDLLRRMNSTLCRNTDKKFFVSLLYGLLDTHTGSLLFSRAGHCPLLYVSDSHSEYLKPQGMGLGLNDALPFDKSLEESSIQLKPNDTLVLYTDGITEAKNVHGEEYDVERLSNIVAINSQKSANDILSSIIDDVNIFRASVEAEDDMTLLVIRWHGTQQ